MSEQSDSIVYKDSNGYVGIGTTTPSHPLHIIGSGIKYNDTRYLQLAEWSLGSGYHDVRHNGPHNTSSVHTQNVSLFAPCVAANQIQTVSDRRIKTDISLINDNTALNQVNNLENYEYHYMDPLRRNEKKTIGFIAQEVKEIIPNAVNIISEYIPDELRLIQNKQWSENINDSKYKLTISDLDLSGNHTGNCRFYVSDDPSGNDETMIDVMVEEDKKSFILDKKWNNVFLWGKEVDDFHTLDKNMIFALHHSAIQELSRKNDAKTDRIDVLEENNQELTQKYNTLETKYNTLETKYNTLETENAQLKSDIALIKQQLGL